MVVFGYLALASGLAIGFAVLNPIAGDFGNERMGILYSDSDTTSIPSNAFNLPGGLVEEVILRITTVNTTNAVLLWKSLPHNFEWKYYDRFSQWLFIRY